MRFRIRPSMRLGPFRLYFTEHGYSSWSFRLWRWTYNSRLRAWTFDTPGPGSVRFDRHR
jgi:hypothetical protein